VRRHTRDGRLLQQRTHTRWQPSLCSHDITTAATSGACTTAHRPPKAAAGRSWPPAAGLLNSRRPHQVIQAVQPGLQLSTLHLKLLLLMIIIVA
jgi:hypothetical protein